MIEMSARHFIAVEDGVPGMSMRDLR